MQYVLLYNFRDKMGVNLRKKVFLEELIQLFLEASMKRQHMYFASR